MARRRNPFIQWLISRSSIAFVRGMGALPLGVTRRLGRCIGRLGYYIVPRVRKVGMANLDLAYGRTLARDEKVRILKQAAENVGIVAAEFARIPQLAGDFLEKHVNVKGLEHIEGDGGRLAIGAHLGNWEWMPAVLANLDLKVAAVVRPLDEPRLNDFVDGIRTSAAFQTIPKDKAGREVVRLLEDGWLVGIVIDQSPRENAVPVRFFGQPCWATIGPVMAATRARVPIHPVSMTRSEDGSYTLEFHPEIPMTCSGDPHKDLVENTQRCQDAIEKLVRQNPGQWLWLHRRWKPRARLDKEWRERTSRACSASPKEGQQGVDSCG